jgi:hypothetical protein
MEFLISHALRAQFNIKEIQFILQGQIFLGHTTIYSLLNFSDFLKLQACFTFKGSVV